MNNKEATELKRNDYIKSLLNIPPAERNEKILLELMSFTKNFKLFDTIGMTNEHAYICKSMGLAHYKPNEIIVKQGDKGDSFFYILSGIVKIIITKKYDLGPDQGEISIDKYIGDLRAGQTFGELSLIYGTERSATIAAVTNATLIRIDKLSFDSYVKDIFENQLKDEIDFMKVCPLFHKVEKEKLIKLAIRTEMTRFSTGQKILKLGARSDVVFLIRRGSVKVTKRIKFIKNEGIIREKILEESKNVKLLTFEERQLFREKIDEQINNTLLAGPTPEDIGEQNFIDHEVSLEVLKIGDIFPSYYSINGIYTDVLFEADTPCELILIKLHDLSDMIPEAYSFIKTYSKPYPNDDFLRKFHYYNSQWKHYKQTVKNNIKADFKNKIS